MARTAADLQPSVLAGPPTSVDGFVHYRNDGDTPVDITEVTVRDPDGGEAAIAVESITVGPGRTARIAVRLGLNPQTAPGSYPLTITIAGVELTATAHISPNQEVGIDPAVLIVNNVPGSSITATVVVANNGNVPAFLADFGTVPLFREDAALTTLLSIANRSPALGVPDIERLPEPDATIAVTSTVGRVEIAAGDTVAAEISVEIPEGLEQAFRYLAALPISVRTLLLTVVPAGAKDDQE